MLKNLTIKKISIAGLITLIPLNLTAFYFIKSSIESTILLQKIQDPVAIQSLQEKKALGNLFTAAVVTIDIIFVLFFLYLLFKLLTKSLKNINQ